MKSHESTAEESKGSTAEQRAEIRARLDAALPGPWFGFRDNDGQGTEILIASKLQAGQDALNSAICDVCAVDGANEDAGLVLGWGNGINQANAELIAHAPADLVALLEDVRVRDERIAKIADEAKQIRRAFLDFWGAHSSADITRVGVEPRMPDTPTLDSQSGGDADGE